MKTLLSGKNYIFAFIALGIIVFFNGMFGNFIWDDKVYIVNNPELTPFNIVRLFGPNIFNKAVYYRPIPATYFSFLLNTFKDQTFFYHIVQLCLHITNTILVFQIFKHFFQKKLSLFLAAIFLVHPMQVESVSYIAAAVSPVFTLFGLSALLVLIKGNFSKAITIFTLTLLILASILTKETGVMFGILCILYAVLFQKKNLLPSVFSTVLALILYFFFRFQIGHVFFDKSQILPLPIMRASLFERILTMPKVVFYYLVTVLLPVVLVSDQHWVVKNFTVTSFLLPLVFDVFIAGLVFFLGYKVYKKKIAIVFYFFLGWFILGMAPHLQIIPLDMTVADRWFYFSFIGLLGLIGVFIENFSHVKKFEKTAFVVLGIFICIFSVRTIARNIDWQSPLYLYSHDLVHQENNFDMQNNLGNELFQVEDYKNAKIHFEKSIQVAPEQSMNYTNLAAVYALEKNYDQAYAYFNKAISNNPTYYPAYEKMAFVYISQARYEDAKKFLKGALIRFPDQPILYIFLAESNYKTGDKYGAIQAAKKALEIQPSDYNRFIYQSLKDNREIQ